ncbi:MAG TPA: class I SAM-dependent methyltransferase [Nitrospinota bacterium]|nr:class I SAM-dependent methyltransferase [Nitrospinota bacterium]|tara:strand:+ start:5483 stop:6403 length:921 start_codon:yes stop_codon:yes gene_type:complete
MALMERACPICNTIERDNVVTLRQDDFTLNNSSYDLSEIPALGLDPEHEYTIVECHSCHLIYSLTHLYPEGEEQVYNKIINAKVSREKIMTWGRRTGDLKRWSELLAVAGKKGKEKIDVKLLDYGCGWGTLLQVASGPGVTAVGFDVTSWKVAFAREQGVTVCTQESELSKYAPFDLLVSTSVLEHLHFPADAVHSMSSFLKSGGYAYITGIIGDVARRSDWEVIKALLARNEEIPKEINPWEHLNYFTNETFLDLMRSNGFKPVDAPAGSNGTQGLMVGLKSALKQRYPFLKNKNAVSGFWQKRS